MTLGKPSSSMTVQEQPKKRLWSMVAHHFIGEGFDPEEFAPISEREFRVMMGLVILATSVFGFIMQVWTQ